MNTQSQLHISILMHLSCASQLCILISVARLDLSCASPSQCICIVFLRIHLYASSYQLRFSIMMHLNLSCVFPSRSLLRISISMNLFLRCTSSSRCISISVAHLHLYLSCASQSRFILISVAYLHLNASRSQLRVSFSKHLDHSCASPS